MLTHTAEECLRNVSGSFLSTSMQRCSSVTYNIWVQFFYKYLVLILVITTILNLIGTSFKELFNNMPFYG